MVLQQLDIYRLKKGVTVPSRQNEDTLGFSPSSYKSDN